MSTDVNKKRYREEGVRFIQGLLSDVTRRLAILLHWHERAPTNDTNLVTLWNSFINTLLYKKVDFRIDTTGLYLFGDSKAFFIPYSWLTRAERGTVQYMIGNRQHFFLNKEKIYHGSRMLLTGFVGNKHKDVFNLYARKRILRDFTSLVYQMTPPLRLPLAMILQNIGIEHADPFYVLLSKTLIGYTPDGPSLTPIK